MYRFCVSLAPAFLFSSRGFTMFFAFLKLEIVEDLWPEFIRFSNTYHTSAFANIVCITAMRYNEAL